jgi:MoaA/NifB/PqqE/SkfB family radical SAM enzyme
MTQTQIVCIPDLLRNTRRFPEGVFDLVREPIRQACDIDIGYPPESKKARGLLPGFDLAHFRSLAGVCNGNADDADEHWADVYYRFPTEAQDYLFAHLPDKTLVLSFEMPPWFRQAYIDRNISFIDIRVSPLRFGRDLYFALCCPDVKHFQRIHEHAVSEEELRLEASLLAANIRMHQRGLQESGRYHFDLDSALVFIGQLPHDASLLTPEGRLCYRDFADRIRTIASTGRQLLYKAHPFSGDFAEEERRTLETITGRPVRICLQNAYQILSTEDDVEVIGISSGLLQEAVWFGKTAHVLYQPYVPLTQTTEPAANVYQQIHFQTLLSPGFWHQVLTPERPKPKIHALPMLPHSHARETLDQWWDYGKVLTWERALPIEAFTRSGGGLLHERLNTLENRVAVNAVTSFGGGVGWGGEPIIREAEVKHWKKLSTDHLRPLKNRDAAMALFKKSVTMVAIETSSYCNRRCWFCPNAFIDRISSNTFMPLEMYTSILQQLASIAYSGIVAYSVYSEPLADKAILERIAEARNLLPDALLHTNTNGDYLDHEYVRQLYDAGLRSLNIQIYLGNKEHYDHEKTKKAANKTLERLGLPSVPVHDRPGMSYERRLYYRDMSILLYGRNWDEDGASRGGLVPIRLAHRRSSPCLAPFQNVNIFHDGSIMPCCNLRPDVEAHSAYIVGNLAENPDLFMLYANQKLAALRASLLGVDLKRGVCGSCNFSEEQPSLEQIEQMKKLLQSASDSCQ